MNEFLLSFVPISFIAKYLLVFPSRSCFIVFVLALCYGHEWYLLYRQLPKQHFLVLMFRCFAFFDVRLTIFDVLLLFSDVQIMFFDFHLLSMTLICMVFFDVHLVFFHVLLVFSDVLLLVFLDFLFAFSDDILVFYDVLLVFFYVLLVFLDVILVFFNVLLIILSDVLCCSLNEDNGVHFLPTQHGTHASYECLSVQCLRHLSRNLEVGWVRICRTSRRWHLSGEHRYQISHICHVSVFMKK